MHTRIHAGAMATSDACEYALGGHSLGMTTVMAIGPAGTAIGMGMARRGHSQSATVGHLSDYAVACQCFAYFTSFLYASFFCRMFRMQEKKIYTIYLNIEQDEA